jgi:S1-C subfamily serine protease
LALLKTDETDGMKTMGLSSQDEISQGDDVVALGYPANASLEDNLTSTAGTVSVVKSAFRLSSPKAPPLENVVQIDAALSPGNSGGPLFNKKGRLVGVNTAIVTEIAGAPIQGQGYAIGVDRVREVAKDLRAGRSLGWTGFGVAPPPRSFLRMRNLPQGMLAGAPVPGTAAADLGIEEMLITELNGNPLAPNMISYCDAVDGIDSGATVPATIIEPEGEPRQVELEFE